MAKADACAMSFSLIVMLIVKGDEVEAAIASWVTEGQPNEVRGRPTGL
jgi:hypothetical protein